MSAVHRGGCWVTHQVSGKVRHHLGLELLLLVSIHWLRVVRTCWEGLQSCPFLFQA